MDSTLSTNACLDIYCKHLCLSSNVFIRTFVSGNINEEVKFKFLIFLETYELKHC